MATKPMTKQQIRDFVIKNLDAMLKRLPNTGRLRLDVNKTEVGTKIFADVGNKRIGFMVMKAPDIATVGMGNIIDKKTPNLARFPHCLFIDYDNIWEYFVREELKWLTEEYPITPFYLFYTKRNTNKEGSKYEKYSGNYSAISLTKMTFKKAYDILQTTHSDFNYKRVPHFIKYKFWVLRMIAKKDRPAPKFLCMIPEDPKKWNLEPEVSRVHLKLLEKWYGIPKVDYHNIDDSTETFLTPYLTGKG